MHSEETNYFVNDSIWLDNFNDLDTSETTIVEYVWIGGTGQDLRSKARSFPGKPPKSHLDCPEWNFDGSSTGQAPGNDSEILLRPVAMFRDPFRRDPHKVRREEKNKRVRERSSSKRKKKKTKTKTKTQNKNKNKSLSCASATRWMELLHFTTTALLRFPFSKPSRTITLGLVSSRF